MNDAPPQELCGEVFAVRTKAAQKRKGHWRRDLVYDFPLRILGVTVWVGAKENGYESCALP